MADRPSADSDRQPASYSPPPQHRPSWIDDGWGQQPAPTVNPQHPGRRRPVRRLSETCDVPWIMCPPVGSWFYRFLVETGVCALLPRRTRYSEPSGLQQPTRGIVEIRGGCEASLPWKYAFPATCTKLTMRQVCANVLFAPVQRTGSGPSGCRTGRTTRRQCHRVHAGALPRTARPPQ